VGLLSVCLIEKMSSKSCIIVSIFLFWIFFIFFLYFFYIFFYNTVSLVCVISFIVIVIHRRSDFYLTVSLEVLMLTWFHQLMFRGTCDNVRKKKCKNCQNCQNQRFVCMPVALIASAG